MKTIYNTDIKDNLTSEYLSILTNKVFALLPMFEESLISNSKKYQFKTYQQNLIQTINGNVNFIQYDSCLIIDILSHLQALYLIENHDDYKRHIFKICNLLNTLKEEVNDNGI